jgi:hypothetical protein
LKSLIKTLPCTFSLWLLIPSFILLASAKVTLASVQKAQFLKHKQFYGTPRRLEYEVKLALAVDKDFKQQKLANEIQNLLSQLIIQNQLKFSELVNSSYHIDPEIKSFVFKDYYLDTQKLDLLNANAAYRLRYRWTHHEKYMRSLLFPFLKSFYPDRCEIQLKFGYSEDQKNQTVKVWETRFEFRNQSQPFNRELNAPSPPWPFKEYLEYAQSGIYQGHLDRSLNLGKKMAIQYPILPMHEMLTQALPQLTNIQLNQLLPVETLRLRTHLNIKNPWGSGPNPEQAFIISIDFSQTKANKKIQAKSVLEIEIEIDRNITTQIENLTSSYINEQQHQKGSSYNKAKPKFQSDSEAIYNFSMQAKTLLNLDLHFIKSQISKLIRSKYTYKVLTVKNKYKRLRE